MKNQYKRIKNFSKKQIIAGGLFAIFIIVCIYFYFNIENNEQEIIQSENNSQEKDVIQAEENNISKEKQEEKIFVHISGAVISEGVVELEENSRVSDAIEKAGGLKEDANLNEVNLAYKLEDGVKIHIPTNSEQEEKEKQSVNAESNYDIRTEEKETTININKATQTELETLPGIGPSTALKIINYREENGNFKTIEDIKKVSGIGEAKYNNIKSLITV